MTVILRAGLVKGKTWGIPLNHVEIPVSKLKKKKTTQKTIQPKKKKYLFPRVILVTAAMKLKDAYSLEGKLWPT